MVLYSLEFSTMIEHGVNNGISIKPFHGDDGISRVLEGREKHRRNLIGIATMLSRKGLYNWSEVFSMTDEQLRTLPLIGVSHLKEVRSFQGQIQDHKKEKQPSVEIRISKSNVKKIPMGLEIDGIFVPLIFPFGWDGFYRLLQEGEVREYNSPEEFEKKVKAMYENEEFLYEAFDLGLEVHRPARKGNISTFQLSIPEGVKVIK